MKNDVLTIDMLKQIFKKAELSCYVVSMESSTDVYFLSTEDFFDFLYDNKITTVFISAEYCNVADYIITDDFLDTERQRYGEFLPEVLNDITKYNKSLQSIDFAIPFTVIATCMYNGCACSIEYSNDNYFSKFNLQQPSDKLLEIMTKHEDAIFKKRDEEYQQIEDLQNDFRQYLLNDPAFLRCTNRLLRSDYLSKFMHKNCSGKFALLVEFWTPRGIGEYTREAELFVESVWREIKSSK